MSAKRLKDDYTASLSSRESCCYNLFWFRFGLVCFGFSVLLSIFFISLPVSFPIPGIILPNYFVLDRFCFFGFNSVFGSRLIPCFPVSKITRKPKPENQKYRNTETRKPNTGGTYQGLLDRHYHNENRKQILYRFK